MELIRKFQTLSLQAVINLLEDFINDGIKKPEKDPGGCRCARGLSCCGGKGNCGGNCHKKAAVH